MVLLSRVHMEPFSMWYNRRAASPPSFITYHGTNPLPMNWQTTYCIHRQNLASSRQAPPESGGTGDVGLSPCHQLLQTAVFPGCSELVFRTESGSCGWAHIQLTNQLIPTNLNKSSKVNNLNNFNNLHNDNNHNNLNKTEILTTMTIMTIILIITILRIVICLASTQEHSQTIWTLCRFVLRQRKGAKAVRTKLTLAWPRKHHFQYLEAKS